MNHTTCVDQPPRACGLGPSVREWDPLAEHTVADAMSRWVVSVAPETSVVTAARLMTSSRIHRVVVLDRDRLCGVLSTLDLVRAVGQGRV